MLGQVMKGTQTAALQSSQNQVMVYEKNTLAGLVGGGFGPIEMGGYSSATLYWQGLQLEITQQSSTGGSGEYNVYECSQYNPKSLYVGGDNFAGRFRPYYVPGAFPNNYAEFQIDYRE
jgi:hypothetical protein